MVLKGCFHVGATLCRLWEFSIFGVWGFFLVWMLAMSFLIVCWPCSLDKGCVGVVVTRAFTACLAWPPFCSVVVTAWWQADSLFQVNQVLGRPKSSFRFSCKMLWKNLNELLGQPNIYIYIYTFQVPFQVQGIEYRSLCYVHSTLTFPKFQRSWQLTHSFFFFSLLKKNYHREYCKYHF